MLVTHHKEKETDPKHISIIKDFNFVPTIKESKGSSYLNINLGKIVIAFELYILENSTRFNNEKEHFNDHEKWKLDKYSYESLRRDIRSKNIAIRKRLRFNKSQEVKVPRI